ncbi:threonine/serine exporter family protein [Lactobacillus sp. S2-2]|uniref:threonine/serine exporter family protein n=1 Tax=Lactobacillus sp. S2-2 TaxID=2692917 RepID=UPI001F1A4B4B|nr:threonine/serine exporter family protein [Lactobacillus sp. S2-2]MCF6515478.1 threonine/serine exporter family protein [Lactobacillus sp. S2-2]
MQSLLLSTILAIISSVSFSIIANVPKRALVPAGITGALSWIGYYLINVNFHSIMIPNLIGGLIVGIVGMYFAKKIKVPVIMIYIGSLISLVPGGMAFSSLVRIHQSGLVTTFGGLFNALIVAIGITVGLGISTFINNLIKFKFSKNKQSK